MGVFTSAYGKNTMSKYWSTIVGQLSPYVPGEQPKIDNLIKLNTNENPYPPSPSVLHALKGVEGASLRLYPDPNADVLKKTIADYFGKQPNQVFVGNGSDEVLAHCFQALLKQDKPLLYPDITYSFYPVYCGLYEIDYQTVALDDEFGIQLADYPAENGGIIFPNPNAPTGRAVPLADIEALLQRNQESVVVVDEAYVDFGAESAISLVDKYDNVLVIQTVSKSRSLAGLRVGYAIGHPDLIDGLERVKNSFNSYPLDRYAQTGVIESFQDDFYFQRMRQKVMDTRERVAAALAEMQFTVVPSSANFVFVSHAEQSAESIALALRERNIIVRYFNKPRIDNYLRITIGTDEECDALLAALAEILA